MSEGIVKVKCPKCKKTYKFKVLNVSKNWHLDGNIDAPHEDIYYCATCDISFNLKGEIK